MTGAFPPNYYEALERRLTALSPLVAATAPADVVNWCREYVTAGDYGLAVEIAAEQLDASMSPEVAELASGLLPEAELMGLPTEIIERLRRSAQD